MKPFLRDLLSECSVSANDLISPYFLLPPHEKKSPILSMPGQYRYPLKDLLDKLSELVPIGLKGIALFPCVPEDKKNVKATESYNPNHFYQIAIKEIKAKFPDLLIMTDVALDPYSSQGHDGLVDELTGEILNDETIEILVKMSIVQAQSGADLIGPSDMMDGRIGAIRKGLDLAGFSNTAIISYCAKYASHFYGPFRDALDSTPKIGDKKTYQMNYSNRTEAFKELVLDQTEGADIVMVKPGISYLDIVRDFKERSQLPVAAYNVSGEYAMVKAAHEKKWINGPMVMHEMLTSFKRAGCDIILSYFTEEFLKDEFFV